MTLIKSISGIRGTIGGKAGEGLTPIDIVKFTAAFGRWIIGKTNNNKIVIGRDARTSGEMVSNLVTGTLQGTGLDVIDLGLAPTPTVEIAIPEEKAGGGIVITASHNTRQWNALKLLNDVGEFISGEDGKEVIGIAEQEDLLFPDEKKIGSYNKNNYYIQKHLDMILSLPLVDKEAIRAKGFKVVIDCINSVGGICIPQLLQNLGVKDIIEINGEPTGKFAHNPEPLPEHLQSLANEVTRQNAHLGIAVDPDVDRLAFVCEDGSMFGEEYTLVAVADYIMQKKKGNTVSNLSSTKALKDITEKSGGEHHDSAVGEIHVVKKMKEVNAVIGGEGNGGVILPELHYGRDALAGIALFLSHLARFGKTCSSLKNIYPKYFMYKNKMQLENNLDIDQLLSKVQEKYKNKQCNTIDGLKIDFEPEFPGWVHLRQSNTEPIIRIYTEAASQNIAESLGNKILDDIKSILKGS